MFTHQHNSQVYATLFSTLLVCNNNILPSWSLAPNSWQKRLDRALLDIDGGKPEARFRSIQRAISDENFLSDLERGVNAIREKGIGKGHPEFIDAVWPKGTIARSDIEGIQSLLKTLPERREESFADNSDQLKIIQESVKTILGPQSISKIFQKVNKNRKDSTTKLENIFRSKPKKVDYIPSTTIATFNADAADDNPTIKIEQYDSYRSISCDLDSSDFTLLNMGSGFSQLTAFVLGNNNYKDSKDDEEGSSTIIADRVTTPFIMQKSKMWIKCPSNMESVKPKEDSSSALNIEDRPVQTLALLEFSGICTNEEIERQKETLMSLMKDNKTEWTVVDHEEEVFVLQYNAPGTLPWRRINQIGVAVEKGNTETLSIIEKVREETEEIEEEEVEAEEEENDEVESKVSTEDEE